MGSDQVGFQRRGEPEPHAEPSWTLWFLLALGIFRLVLPYLALLRWPLVWPVLISVGAGYLPNVDSTFSLSRTLGFLPFFVLGWWVHEHDLVNRLRLIDFRPWWLRAIALLVFAVDGFIAWNWVNVWKGVDLDTWFFYNDSYSDLGSQEWWSGGIRLLLIVIGLVLSVAFFALIPEEATGGRSSGSTRCMSTCCTRSCCTRSANRAFCATRSRPGSGCRASSCFRSRSPSLLPPSPCAGCSGPWSNRGHAGCSSDERLAETSRREDPTGSRRPRDR